MKRPDRGQTTLDFTIGITIFVVVLAGVFLFVPGTLQPFEQGGQEDIVTVNRVADQLSEQLLTESGEPYILHDDCTVEFFGGPDASTECEFSGGTLQQQVGHGDLQFMNVSIRGPRSGSSGPNIRCYDSDKQAGERLVSLSDCGDPGETRLAVGRAPVSVDSTVTARRVVELDGQDVFLVVELW